MMGCYIEALEQGANVLIQTGGTCRLGYYGELHEQILKDMGYDFEMFNLTCSVIKSHRYVKGHETVCPECLSAPDGKGSACHCQNDHSH